MRLQRSLNDNTPAQNRKDIGRALANDLTLDDKTYERRGKLAVDDALKDICKVFQILAAA